MIGALIKEKGALNFRSIFLENSATIGYFWCFWVVLKFYFTKKIFF